MDAIEAQLRLGRARGLRAARLRTLLATLREPRSDSPLLALVERSPPLRAALLCVDARRVQADRDWVEREGIRLLDLGCVHYPPRLAQIRDAPGLLYIKGDVSVLCTPQLAIVGTRTPTAHGLTTAQRFAAELAHSGFAITSGLALGIDAASHEGALEAGGRTVAVLGSGIDQIYPRAHAALAEAIAASGTLVSEFPPASAPRRSNFPRRNRIISALSVGLLVVEASQDSGSLITARLATRQGREVFAIPGSINNPYVRGCHALIRGGAKLVEEPADILQELKLSSPKQKLMKFPDALAGTAAGSDALDKDYEILLDAIGFDSASLDALVERTGLPSQSVASMLLILELDGAVGMQADGRYVRL
jgi:DNA processing protein